MSSNLQNAGERQVGIQPQISCLSACLVGELFDCLFNCLRVSVMRYHKDYHFAFSNLQ